MVKKVPQNALHFRKNLKIVEQTFKNSHNSLEKGKKRSSGKKKNYSHSITQHTQERKQKSTVITTRNSII